MPPASVCLHWRARCQLQCRRTQLHTPLGGPRARSCPFTFASTYKCPPYITVHGVQCTRANPYITVHGVQCTRANPYFTVPGVQCTRVNPYITVHSVQCTRVNRSLRNRHITCANTLTQPSPGTHMRPSAQLEIPAIHTPIQQCRCWHVYSSTRTLML